MTRRGPSSLFALLTTLAVLGCAASEPIDLPASRGGATGGSSGTGGDSATRGDSATGGYSATGGAAATGGSGAAGTGGVAATGGKIGAGGLVGTGGTRNGTGGKTVSTGGTTNTDGGGVTFTDVYTQVIATNCFGSGCHDPAASGRPSFASQASCYTYFKNQGQLYPGQTPSKSYIYFIMSGDPTASPPSPPYMPPTPAPNVSAADLALVAAWIADGALNN